MRYLLLILIFSIFLLPAAAQDETQTPYEIALQMIEEARVNGWTRLDFAGMGLTALPPEIGSLENLKLLYLSDNQLMTLPSQIGNLINLQALFLENNQLNTLAPEIGNLRHLSWLFLDNNQLNTLPPEIDNLNQLCVLRLNHNQIYYLPTYLSQLQKLRETECHLYLGTGNIYFADGIGWKDGLSLDGNPLISPPQEVIDQGTPAILDYLRNEAWWYIRKLIAGGAGAVGLVTAAILGIRWRNRQRYEKKKKGTPTIKIIG